MNAFEYVEANSIDEAVSLLAEKSGNARVLAGGTDLIVQMRGGGRRPERVVQLSKVPEANAITFDPRNGLWLGSAVPCFRIYENETVQKNYPGILDSASMIGSIQIQGRATIGGNLCNAAPSADAVPPVIALNGVAVIAGPNGTREVPTDDFCTGPGQNMLQPGEFLVAIKVPPPQTNQGSCYIRFIPRNEMDIAIAGSGVSVVLDDSGNTITSAKVVLSAVAPTPLVVPGVQEAAAGQPANEDTVARVGQLAREAARPINDMRGTIEQRRQLSDVLTKRSLRTAIQRAKEAS